jgi:nucleoside-diphosphate-sugar epimerase
MAQAQKVLVTGASGFVAASVLSTLLKRGYSVKGTVRSQKKADQIVAKYPQYKDKLSFAIVEDIAKDGAFEGVLDDVDGIFHVASPFHYKAQDNKTGYLDPAIKGTTGILETALKAPRVKRVVVTSSFAAILDLSRGPSSYAYSEKDWNPITWEQAVNGDARLGYIGSKKFAEKSVYDFVEAKKPHFDVVTLNPPLILGPIEQHIDKLSELNESAMMFYEYASGKKKIEDPRLDVYVDVRDLALAHALAYETPEASNQRFLITAGNYDWQMIADVAHKYFPTKTKADVGRQGVRAKHVYEVDNTKSIKVLGMKYRTWEETFKDAVEQIIQFEEQGL